MKLPFYIFILFCIASIRTVFAQDTTIQQNSDELSAKVTTLPSRKISYREINYEKGLEYSLPQQEVVMVMYDDSAKVIPPLASEEDTLSVMSSDSYEQLYFMGNRDADLYYKGNGALWGTFGATIIYAPVGVVAGIVAGVVPPKIENTAPEYELLQEAAYREGYTKKAKKRKWGKVAVGFGLGLLTNVLVYSIVVNSAN